MNTTNIFPRSHRCYQYCTYNKYFTKLYLSSLCKLGVSSAHRLQKNISPCWTHLPTICWQLAVLYTVFEPHCIYFIAKVCFVFLSASLIGFHTVYSLLCVNTACSSAKKSPNFFTLLLVTAESIMAFLAARMSAEFFVSDVICLQVVYFGIVFTWDIRFNSFSRGENVTVLSVLTVSCSNQSVILAFVRKMLCLSNKPTVFGV